MARPSSPGDPYRTLGIPPGADLRQVKAAHRQLAKRFHPDGATGDESRFLAVQEAYQLLSDPVRRREWDRRHAPGPMRAAGSPAAGGPTRGGRSHRSSAAARGASTGSGATGAGATSRRRGTPRRPRPQPAPGQRTTTWSAAHVPWWQDFTPRSGGTGPGDDPDIRGRGSKARRAEPERTPAGATMDFEVFDRSSGAAWSAAARQHFRRGTSDLPSRGVWRYRGTQVVTGAEARKVAAEEDAERRRKR